MARTHARLWGYRFELFYGFVKVTQSDIGCNAGPLPFTETLGSSIAIYQKVLSSRAQQPYGLKAASYVLARRDLFVVRYLLTEGRFGGRHYGWLLSSSVLDGVPRGLRRARHLVIHDTSTEARERVDGYSPPTICDTTKCQPPALFYPTNASANAFCVIRATLSSRSKIPQRCVRIRRSVVIMYR